MLLTATHSAAGVSPQDRMIDLLAGTAAEDSSDAHQQVVEDMIRLFEAQKLISLQTLFELADNLESVTRGEKLNTALAAKLATRISEIQLPQKFAHHQREKFHVVRLLDRPSRGRPAQIESSSDH